MGECVTQIKSGVRTNVDVSEKLRENICMKKVFWGFCYIYL